MHTTKQAPLTKRDAPLAVAGLVFDMGDVLYDATVWRRWLLQLLTHLGLHTQYDAFFCVWEREHLPEVYCGRLDYWQALRIYLSQAGLSHGQITEVFAAVRSRRRALETAVRPLCGVARCLAQLSASGWPMAVLENSDYGLEFLLDELDQLHLSSHFSTVICSSEIGHAKPQLGSYLAAADALGLPLQELAFVGHDSAELQGAAEAKMATIAISAGPQVEADLELARLDELPTRIEPLASHRRVG